MKIAQQIRKKVDAYPQNMVFSASELGMGQKKRGAVIKTLNRMVGRGGLTKLKKGKFFKSRVTTLGTVPLSADQMIRDLLVRNGEIVGYTTGYSAYNSMYLTTQISSSIQIGTNKYKRPLKRGAYSVSFVVQPNVITAENIEILRILDALRFIREIPGTTADEACRRLIEIVKDLTPNKQELLVSCALNYTSYVRALIGAILQLVGGASDLVQALEESLNGQSRYKLPISETVLPNKEYWKIYES